MPEYTLDRSLAQNDWARLDPFTQGYIEAAMWTLTVSWFECADCNCRPDEWTEMCPECSGKVREHTDSADHLGLQDIAAETIAKAVEDCEAFQTTYRHALDRASRVSGRDDDSHGHDFWLTRNGHGAGFWDRGYPAELSKVLTQGSKSFGSCDWYIGDDGNVYQY